MKYLDPTGVIARKSSATAITAVHDLSGKTVGILSNLWPSFEKMIGRFRDQLTEKHHVARIIRYEIPRNPAEPDALLDKIAAECDAAIVGLAN